MQDCRERITNEPQITTDAHKPYMKAVEAAFGGDADYAMLHKVYGASNEPETRYSPATCIGCDMKVDEWFSPVMQAFWTMATQMLPQPSE